MQGLLELIERDAVALWWYNRLTRRGVDMASFEDSYTAQLSSHYQGLQRTLYVIDVTSDLGIPTFAAISARMDKAEEDIIYGFGCHLDPAIALSRALTEINQSLEAVPKAGGLPREITYRGSPEAMAWWREVRLSTAPYLNAAPGAALVGRHEMQSLASDDIRTDIETCLALLAAKNIDVLVLEQTRPDVGLPVVRVVAPGLRHFWARFGPGRLYDAPVEAGWCTHPTAEADLNPYIVQF